jgi:hypothetical protein
MFPRANQGIIVLFQSFPGFGVSFALKEANIYKNCLPKMVKKDMIIGITATHIVNKKETGAIKILVTC